MPDPIVEALSAFSSCDCSDALLKLNFPNGGYIDGPTMWSPRRQEGDTKIVGPAYTVQYALNSDPRPKVANHYIDSVPPGAVVFISCPYNVLNAVYGGLMTARAKASGAVGTVVDGRIRDLREHREADFPVFAAGVGTAAPHETVKVVAFNVPVTTESPHQSITIHPGDYIVGDPDGVVVVPQGLAAEAVRLMEPQVEADERMAEAIRGGMSFTEASQKYRGK